MPKPTTMVDPMENPFDEEAPPFDLDEESAEFGAEEEAPAEEVRRPRTRERRPPHRGPTSNPPPPPEASRPPPPPDPPRSPAALSADRQAAEQAAPPVASEPAKPPARPSLSAGRNIDHYAEQGMEGLEVTFGAYPVIRLINEGVFETYEGEPLGKEFLCILQASKPKFIYKATGTDKDDDRFAYTFDHELTAQGEPLRDVIESWERQGYGYEVKKYLDVLAVLVDESGGGEEVILSIPKTSIGRLTRYLGTLERRHGCPFNQCVTRVFCGEKITKTRHAFYPWGFEFHEKL